LPSTGSRNGGRDGDVLWFEQTSVGCRLLWGRADGRWLFVASAPMAGQLDALLATLQQSVGGAPIGTR
jgi:hypothetical protein